MIPRHAIAGSLAALVLAAGSQVLADDRDDLAALLDEFLAEVDSADMHDRFWDDELVYTSSNGTRFGKDTIMAGFEAPPDETDATSYVAEEVDIRVYDDMAIVAFVLVGTAADGSVTRYLNTGTLARRDAGWKVVAWQATRAAE